MKPIAKFALLCSMLLLPVGAFAKDEAKKEVAKPINKICPVEKGEIDPEVTTEYQGKTIGFCCASCIPEFKKEPAKYMAIVAKEQDAAKDKEKDKADKSKDNKKDAKDAKDGEKKKDEKPKKQAELNTKCPVSGDDADKTITTDYKGRKIAFCCEDCQKDFAKDPKKYLAKLDKEQSGKSGEKKKDDAEREKDGKSEKPAK
jgi:YHS domain-containing protein